MTEPLYWDDKLVYIYGCAACQSFFVILFVKVGPWPNHTKPFQTGQIRMNFTQKIWIWIWIDFKASWNFKNCTTSVQTNTFWIWFCFHLSIWFLIWCCGNSEQLQADDLLLPGLSLSNYFLAGFWCPHSCSVQGSCGPTTAQCGLSDSQPRHTSTAAPKVCPPSNSTTAPNITNLASKWQESHFMTAAVMVCLLIIHFHTEPT